MIAMKRDSRDKLWGKLEVEIQQRAKKKDRGFRLSGKWKRFVSREDGFRVYAVDGEWVRNNLCAYFGHGGHGIVHEFIPRNEIWIATAHSKGCDCTNVFTGQPVSQAYFDSTVIHEITEHRLMKRGKNYWHAHQVALKKEIEVGLLPDPHIEVSA